MSSEDPIQVNAVVSERSLDESQSENGYFTKRITSSQPPETEKRRVPIVQSTENVNRMDQPKFHPRVVPEFLGKFQYHYRILVAIACSLPPVLSFVNKYTYFVITFGLLLTYLFDFLNRKRHSFFMFIITTALVLATMYVQIGSMYLELVVFDFFFAFNLFMFTLIVCCYGAVNFIWLQKKGIRIIVFLERCVFCLLPFTTTPLIMTTIIEMNGIHNAPFYLVAVLSVQYHFFGSKIRSSFQVSGEYRKNKFHIIPFPVVSVIFIFILLTLPTAFLYGISFNTFKIFTISSSTKLMVLTMGGLFFLFLQPKKYLWCFSKFAVNCYTHPFLRLIALSISAIVVFLYFEYLVFFEQYPHLLVLPPLVSIVFLNIALILGVILFVTILDIRLEKKRRDPSKNFCLTFVIATLCFIITVLVFLVLGISLWAFPLLALTLAGLANFLMTNQWRHFHIFVVSSSLTVLGWCIYHFGFLDVEMDFNLLPFQWTVNLMDVVELIALHFALCFYLIPTLKLKNIHPFVYSFVWGMQVVLLAALEELFFDQSDHEDGSPLYSTFLVCMTTLMYLMILYKGKDKFSFNTMNFLLAVIISKNVILIDSPYQHKMKIFTVLPFVFLSVRGLMYYFKDVKISLPLSVSLIWLFCISTYLCKNVLWIPLFEEDIRRPMEWSEYFVRITTIPNKFPGKDMNSKFQSAWYAFQTVHNFVFAMEPKLFGLMVFVMGLGSIPITNAVNDKRIKRLSFLLLLFGFLWGGFEPLFEFGESDFVISGNAISSSGFYGLFRTLMSYVLLGSTFVFLGFVFRLVYLPRSKIMKLFVLGWLSISMGVGISQSFLPVCRLHVHIMLPISFFITGLILCISHFDIDMVSTISAAADSLSTKPRRRIGSTYSKFPIILVLYILNLCLSIVIFFSSTFFTSYRFMREEYYTIRYTILELLFLENLFICVLLKFLLAKTPLMVDTGIITRKQTEIEVGGVEEEIDYKDLDSSNKELFQVVLISVFVCFITGLYLAYVIFYHSPLQNEIFLLMSSILFLLPNYRSKTNPLVMKSIVIAILIQLECALLFMRDIFDVVMVNVVFGVKMDSIFVLFGMKMLFHSVLLFLLFLGHVYFDSQLADNMAEIPEVHMGVLFLVFGFLIWFIVELSSIRVCAVVLIIEMLILIFVRFQWKRKKFISRNNIFVK